MSTHSGNGEPPQPPEATTPREGVVLPSGGDSAFPEEVRRGGQAQPTSGQPWGQPWGPEAQVGTPPSPAPAAPLPPVPDPGPPPGAGPLPPEAGPGSGHAGYADGRAPLPPQQPPGPAPHQPPPAPPQVAPEPAAYPPQGPPSQQPPQQGPPSYGAGLPPAQAPTAYGSSHGGPDQAPAYGVAEPFAGPGHPESQPPYPGQSPPTSPPAGQPANPDPYYSAVPGQPYPGPDPYQGYHAEPGQQPYQDPEYGHHPEPAQEYGTSGALATRGPSPSAPLPPHSPYAQPPQVAHEPQHSPQPDGQQPPVGDAEATQLIPPFSAQAHAQPQPQPPGAGDDVEATTMLRLPLPSEGAPQRSDPHGAADETALLPPITDTGGAGPGQQAGPPPGRAPYGIRPGGPGDRQPPAEFDNLFRAEPAAAEAPDATQPLPLFAQAADAQQGGGHRPGHAGPGYPGPGGGPGYGGSDPDPGRGSGRRGSRNVVIGIVVACCAVVGLLGGALLSGGDEVKDEPEDRAAKPTEPAATSAQPSPSVDVAKTQATELSKLLGDSNNSRAAVIRSVDNIRKCEKLGQAATDLRGAAQQRNELVTRLEKMTLDQLPEHQKLTGALTTAWKASAKADNHYAAWADQVAKKKGCPKGKPRTTKNLSQATVASGTATQAKQQAAGIWNPLARKYGLPERQVTDL